MGKSMTLSTLLVMKLLGLKDFSRVLHLQGYNEAHLELELEVEKHFSEDEHKEFFAPQPATILVPTRRELNLEVWRKSEKRAFKHSLAQLEKFHKILKEDKENKDTNG